MLQIRKINIITSLQPLFSNPVVCRCSQGNALPKAPKIRHRNNFFAFTFYEEPERYRKIKAGGGTFEHPSHSISPRATHKFTCLNNPKSGQVHGRGCFLGAIHGVGSFRGGGGVFRPKPRGSTATQLLLIKIAWAGRWVKRWRK